MTTHHPLMFTQKPTQDYNHHNLVESETLLSQVSPSFLRPVYNTNGYRLLCWLPGISWLLAICCHILSITGMTVHFMILL